ncbi:hypothetical protein Afil01_33010 [Actinorhabdospora filicis]|uniref:Uncharacterized protein n=2 Tax=Actinorhabdospora filicis TaxID=1785913 RepID=A0A9W6SK41_9ACTN|nr:hypothetical protein Afil01_33010 [Actinorhabdospora filicis]
MRELAIEDLRLLIGQRIGLEFVIPVALERLRDDPLSAGDLYPGDLLTAVLRVLATFWKAQPALACQLREILADVTDRPTEIADAIEAFSTGR